MERVWQGTGSRSHADCLDAAQGLEMHVTNVIQKGAIVPLPYELWEMVSSQFCCTESTRETGELQGQKPHLNSSVLNSLEIWDV